jgi:hypothetical protein
MERPGRPSTSLLSNAGWAAYDKDKTNITDQRGVVITYLPLKSVGSRA